MKIGVLGWGSLIWNQSTLKINNNQWFEDGPNLPIEFARVSGDGRLTLVIKSGAKEIPVLYALSEFKDLESARENLREREGTPDINNIGFFNFKAGTYSIKRLEKEIISLLTKWNDSKKIDAIIWTDLGSNFKNKLNIDFTKANVISYLKSLDESRLEMAKEYIKKTPLQIQTTLRPFMEAIL